jgi:hypothetical protein
MALLFLCSKISCSRVPIRRQCENNKTSYSQFANSWGFGFDVGLQFKKNIGLMVRDITTTYNVWNIDEKNCKKNADAVPGQNQELPESTEITAPKAQMGLSKNLLSVMTTALWLQYQYEIYQNQ